MQKNNAALLYVLCEIKCELCHIESRLRKDVTPCEDCDFLSFKEHYKNLAKSEL